jgi:SAM-dependent methyltransferase
VRNGQSLLELYPTFYENVAVCRQSAFYDVLTARYEALIRPHRAWIEGKRVLDLACGGGGFSYAALHQGCRHVTGVEVSAPRLMVAEENFRRQAIAANRYAFVVGDLHAVAGRLAEPFDTVFCLGYGVKELAHAATLHGLPLVDRYTALFSLIASFRPESVIADLSCPVSLVETVMERLTAAFPAHRIERCDWVDAALPARRGLRRLSFRATPPAVPGSTS